MKLLKKVTAIIIAAAMLAVQLPVSLAAESASVTDSTKQMTVSGGIYTNAAAFGYQPSYSFGEVNNTYLDKYIYYRTYDVDCMGSPVPMTGMYIQPTGGKVTISPLTKASEIYKAKYTDSDRIHFGGYINLISGKISSFTFMTGSIGLGMSESVKLTDLASNKWTRFDMFWQPKITYNYTVTTADGTSRAVTASTNTLISTTNSSRASNEKYWRAVLSAVGQTYDSTSTYVMNSVVFGETSFYLDGVQKICSTFEVTDSTHVYAFSDVVPSRFAFVPSGDFSAAISNYELENIKNYDAESYDFGLPELFDADTYTVDNDARTLTVTAATTAADIDVPVGCSAAVYASDSADSGMKWARVADDAEIENGNIVSVADTDNNIVYYTVGKNIVASNERYVTKKSDITDSYHRMILTEENGIGGKAADDASVRIEWNQADKDMYIEYANGISPSELKTYKGYLKLGYNIYPTDEMPGTDIRFSTNGGLTIANYISMSKLNIKQWNRIEYVIKLDGGTSCIVDTYVNGECISTGASGNYGLTSNGTFRDCFRIGFIVNKGNYSATYIDDIHTFFSNKYPDVYAPAEVPQVNVGNAVSDINTDGMNVRVLDSDYNLCADSHRITRTDIVAAEKMYTEYDPVYSYGVPFAADILLENSVNGNCFAGQQLKAVGKVGRDCYIVVAEYDSDGNLIGTVINANEASYLPKTVGNTVKVFAVNNMTTLKPVLVNKILTVAEPANYFTLAELGDDIDFLPEAMRNYLNDSDYDSCENYAQANKELDKPIPIECTWECSLDNVVKYYVNVSQNADMSNAYSFESTEKSCGVYNLIPGTRYYWTVTAELADGSKITSADAATFSTKDGVRILNVEGIVNARDIGGWKIGDDKRVKYGMLIRTAKPDTPSSVLITPNGVKTMTQQLGIKTEIDFRTDSHHPYGLQNQYPGTNYIRCPFSSASFDNKPAIIDIFAQLADESNYPINYHCLAGADRTGLITYLINGVLGVSRDDLLRDYLLTNFTNNGQWRPVSGIKNYIDLIDNYTGDTYQQKVYGYLVNEIGVPAEHLDALIQIMTEDISQ